MVIVLDNVWESEDWKTQPPKGAARFQVHAYPSGNYSFSLSTSDFEVKHIDGKAEVRLHRDISPEEAKRLARALLAHADECDRKRKEWELNHPQFVAATKKEVV